MILLKPKSGHVISSSKPNSSFPILQRLMQDAPQSSPPIPLCSHCPFGHAALAALASLLLLELLGTFMIIKLRDFTIAVLSEIVS